MRGVRISTKRPLYSLSFRPITPLTRVGDLNTDKQGRQAVDITVTPYAGRGDSNISDIENWRRSMTLPSWGVRILTHSASNNRHGASVTSRTGSVDLNPAFRVGGRVLVSIAPRAGSVDSNLQFRLLVVDLQRRSMHGEWGFKYCPGWDYLSWSGPLPHVGRVD